MKFPCEIIVWKVLPAIRARLACELAKQGLPQKEIAQKLGITEAAVSQYINKKRASEFDFGKHFEKDFKEIARKLKQGEGVLTAMECSCTICKELRKQGLMCQVHKAGSELPSTCDICLK